MDVVPENAGKVSWCISIFLVHSKQRTEVGHPLRNSFILLRAEYSRVRRSKWHV